MKPSKTIPTINKVSLFIDQLKSHQQRKDSRALIELMVKITNKKPLIWGTSIIGFGTYHYKYRSGREGD